MRGDAMSEARSSPPRQPRLRDRSKTMALEAKSAVVRTQNASPHAADFAAFSDFVARVDEIINDFHVGIRGGCSPNAKLATWSLRRSAMPKIWPMSTSAW